MPKSQTRRPAPPPRKADGGKFQDHDLCGMSPEKGQEKFKPQGPAPVRMRAKMGGQP